jgi:hypothetical protein
MGTIVLPHLFADGAAASPANFSDNIFDPLNPATSFAERNGLLDQANFSQKLGHRCFRLGSGALGGTVVSPHPWDFWRGEVIPPPVKQTYRPVPGAGIRFWAPWKCSLLVAWTLVFRSDLEFDSGPGHVAPDILFRLFVNGASQSVSFHVPSATQGMPTAGAGALEIGKRAWTGFWQTQDGVFLTAEQWHQAGIRLWCDHPVHSDDFKHLFLRVYKVAFHYLILKMD